jgi:hypothetical protein
VQVGLSVTVSGVPCTTPVVSGGAGVGVNLTGSEILCVLPASSGGLLRSVVVTSLGQNNPPALLLSYGIIYLSIYRSIYLSIYCCLFSAHFG